MGKHNGKSRKTGARVGSSLANRNKQMNNEHKDKGGRHTTDIGPTGPNMQSIIERNDLDEFLAMAELQGREFAGERGTNDVIVISEGAVATLDSERSEVERTEIEAKHADKLHIPRRPAWGPDTTAEELQDKEKAMFLEWRRNLAKLEEEELLCLTPFEKNLEVWRQLWRVVERSDCIIQVVDARDPLRYYSEDLVEYAQAQGATKRSMLLLNKADLLTAECRAAWADHFDELGVPYAFWSARNAVEEAKQARLDAKLQAATSGVEEAPALQRRQPAAGEDARTAVLDIETLIDRFTEFAEECVAESGAEPGDRLDPRLMVGLIGYPNVGKSSTINALFGSKKTAVAPTPGKTKHFQTLQIEGTKITLCDCPGLVLPRFAASKAEMVAAGVVPIDRLTDVHPSVTIIAKRAGRRQLSAVYGMPLPRPAKHEDPTRPVRSAELINALALTRGWIAGSGLPDETRAGRQLLKDYVDGKLIFLEWPPGTPPELVKHTPEFPEAEPHGKQPAAAPEKPGPSGGAAQSGSAEEGDSAGPSGAADLEIEEGDLELLAEMRVGDKPKRAAHKFHKKAARTKGDRGQSRESGVEGLGVLYGKKGGIIRVQGY
mmetsp:Transcript_15292/g.39482  ORF Transcript_15292/g.39482 Transcript_15292/m.39482 type:complete len:604 (-) Transcript_15292:104-1915(-)